MPTLGLLLSQTHEYKLNQIDVCREEILVAFVCFFSHPSLQPILTGWVLLPEWFKYSTNLCVCMRVHSTMPYCFTNLAVASYSSVMFMCLTLAFVTANFIFYSSSTHTLFRHAHGLGVPFVWQLMLNFCAF